VFHQHLEDLMGVHDEGLALLIAEVRAAAKFPVLRAGEKIE
jgi:hypothetical protein